MEFARKYKDLLTEYYVTQLMSTYQVAEKLTSIEGRPVNANKVRKALEFLGIPRRKYSDAQKVSLQTGRSKHPTEGKTLSEEHRRSVGRGRAKAWAGISDEERTRLSELSKAQWAAMTDSEKSELRRLAAEAVRECSREGSMMEKYLVEALRKKGFTVNFHAKGLIPSDTLEVDMFLPEIKTAIEIDGPAHFLPIWGEENLRKHQDADAKKEGLLINEGYVLIRVKQLDKNMSESRMETVLNAVLVEVDKIVKSFPEESKRLIGLELKDGKITRN